MRKDSERFCRCWICWLDCLSDLVFSMQNPISSVGSSPGQMLFTPFFWVVRDNGAPSLFFGFLWLLGTHRLSEGNPLSSLLRKKSMKPLLPPPKWVLLEKQTLNLYSTLSPFPLIFPKFWGWGHTAGVTIAVPCGECCELTALLLLAVDLLHQGRWQGLVAGLSFQNVFPWLLISVSHAVFPDHSPSGHQSAIAGILLGIKLCKPHPPQQW